MHILSRLALLLILSLSFSHCSKKDQDNPGTITTSVVTGITSSAAVSGGSVNGINPTERGLCWSHTPAPTISNSKTMDGSGDGTFISNITGLAPATKYYLRAYAVSPGGVVYGNEQSFTTNAILTSLITNAATNITNTSATVSATITTSEFIFEKGFCWSITTQPTISQNKIANTAATASFSNTITVGAGTTYYVRSYAQTATGIVYGNEQSFTTLFSPGDMDGSLVQGNGFNNGVVKILMQNDGKILAGGDFNIYRSANYYRLIRMDQNGNPDASFNIGSGFSHAVLSLALQPDGKILAGGSFTMVKGSPVNNLVRLNSDGSNDPSFNTSRPFRHIHDIALQPDGKIIITREDSLQRLNSDGTVDNSFTTGKADGGFRSIVLQPDGKILVGGSFISYNGVAKMNVVRLHSNGSIDNSFNTATSWGTSGGVAAMVLQPDGKLIVGGFFNAYNGNSRKGILRLNTDGSLDNSFDPGSGFSSTTVESLSLLSNGQVMVGGSFDSYNGSVHRAIIRLNGNGTVDESFINNPLFSAYSGVRTIAIQPNGKVLCGGIFVGPGFTHMIRLHN